MEDDVCALLMTHNKPHITTVKSVKRPRLRVEMLISTRDDLVVDRLSRHEGRWFEFPIRRVFRC